jgi:hypothetical protein
MFSADHAFSFITQGTLNLCQQTAHAEERRTLSDHPKAAM